MMVVITVKMLMMDAFVTVKILMMAAFVTVKMLLTMPAFVNDGYNPLLMMVVITVKIFFFR
jgi:hypothetical protein